jgi:hypothetical protein
MSEEDIAVVLEITAASEQLGDIVKHGVIGSSQYRVVEEGNQMGHLANRMRSLASTGNPRAAELIEKADELDKMINADLWDTEQVLGAWLRARKLWCEVTGEPLRWNTRWSSMQQREAGLRLLNCRLMTQYQRQAHSVSHQTLTEWSVVK